MAEMQQMFLASHNSQTNTPRQNTSSPQDGHEEDGNMYDEVESNGSMHDMTTNAHQQHQVQQMNIRAQQGARQIGNIRREVDDVVESNVPVRRHIPLPERQNGKLGGGREVLLYSITRPLNVPVAKGFVQTLDAHALVGGVPLGAQYSEVVISAVYKLDTVLPRPYGDVVNLGSARGKPIAWPTAMMKDLKKRNVVPGGAGA